MELLVAESKSSEIASREHVARAKKPQKVQFAHAALLAKYNFVSNETHRKQLKGASVPGKAGL